MSKAVEKIRQTQSSIYEFLVKRGKVTQQIADSQPTSESMAVIMMDAIRVSKDDAAVAEAAAHHLNIFYLAVAEEGLAIHCAGPEDGWLIYSDVLCVTNPFDKALCELAVAWARNENKNTSKLGVISSSYLGQLRAANVATNTETDQVDDKLALQQIEDIIRNAATMDASDVHFVPDQTDKVEIKYRIDGVLLAQRKVDLTLLRAMVRALLEQKCAVTFSSIHQQDGKCDLHLSGNKMISLRVSTIPVVRKSETAPKLVVRLLGNNAALADLNRMGMSPSNLDKLIRYGNYPSGMIVLTGPTGSGKTTTLYAQLINMQNSNPNRNFHTVEDPVEIQQMGMSHTEVREPHLTFAHALRALLRQDPDVILVGEMRDDETAELAFKASMTGHLVLTTLHTNNSHESVGRLQNMGIGTDLIVTNTTAFLAQRLVRTLCKHCKQPSLLKADEVRNAKYGRHPAFMLKGGDTEVFTKNKSGCKECNFGEKGRRGILEIFEMTAEVQVELLSGKNPSILRREQIAAGTFEDLWDDGLRLVAEGAISFEQLEAELKEYEMDRVGMKATSTSRQPVPVPTPPQPLRLTESNQQLLNAL